MANRRRFQTLHEGVLMLAISSSNDWCTPHIIYIIWLHWLSDVSQHPHVGAGIAQCLECWTRDWKVAGSNPCRSGGRIFNKRHVIMQTSVTSLCKQDKRHVIMLTRQASRHYPNKTSFTSLSKQAPEPLYWHTPPDWYSRYEHVHQYKLFTVCTRVNRCCTIADSFTRLLPTQCRVENGIALPHTLFLLATVKDRNRLAWCDFYFDSLGRSLDCTDGMPIIIIIIMLIL